MSQRSNDNTKQSKVKENQIGILNFMHFAGKFSRGPQVRKRDSWGYGSLYENTPEKLLHLPPKSCPNFMQWFKEAHLEHISHIVKVGIKAVCQHFKPCLILKETTGFKAVMINNLGLCKCSEIYLLQIFQKHCHGSNGIKIQVWQGKIYQTN